MTQQEKLHLLKQAGAIKPVHHRLTSGRHCGEHLECAHLFERTDWSQAFCQEIAEAFRGMQVDVVVGPALGGIIPAYEVARLLGVRCLFAERVSGRMIFRRGFAFEPGEKALIMEDVITTGGSLREVISLIQENGASVVGVGSVIDRSGGKAQFDVPLKVAMTLDFDTYEPEECPYCQEGKALEKITNGNKKRL